MPSRIDEMIALSNSPIVLAQVEAKRRDAIARMLPARHRIHFDPHAQYAARLAVRNAVAQGLLVRPAHCEAPGCTRTQVEAHHHKGYDEEHWLDVVWLCKRHHNLADRDLNGGSPN